MARRVLILAGGTGGHIYPALAVAEVLRQQGVALRWLGAAGGMEGRIVPAAGIELVEMVVAGLRGRGPRGWLQAPFTVLRATLRAIQTIREFKPGVVLGMGGFVSGPGGLAAWLCRRPLVIHEQNAIPGLTNRLLARLATRVLEAYPGSFDAARGARMTGNPVRAAIATLAAQARPAVDGNPALRVLVVGGSRGARRLNTVVPEAIARLDSNAVELWHQTGEADLAATRAAYAATGRTARVDPYITDMPAAYRWADVAVCRAGAMTIAELASAGLPAVLVPFPHAVDDHQTANARYLADAGAAVLVADADLNAEALARQLQGWAQERALLAGMGARARALALPEAANTVAAQCLEVLRA